MPEDTRVMDVGDPCVCVCVSERGEEGSWGDLKALLGRMPDVHHCLLSYLCRFLTEVERHQAHNRMTALNLATVFGPSVFQSVRLTCCTLLPLRCASLEPYLT